MRRIIAVLGFLTIAAPASADHKVYSPIVEEGVLELEARGIDAAHLHHIGANIPSDSVSTSAESKRFGRSTDAILS